jgi:hypothetical protein
MKLENMRIFERMENLLKLKSQRRLLKQRNLKNNSFILNKTQIIIVAFLCLLSFME